MKSNNYNWRFLKYQKSVQFIDDILFEIIDQFIFDTIIDFFRINYGFPCATMLSDLIFNNPIIPKTPDYLTNVSYKPPQSNFITKCPLCNQKIDDSNFTSHWKNECSWFQQNGQKQLESYVFKYFEEHEEKK